MMEPRLLQNRTFSELVVLNPFKINLLLQNETEVDVFALTDIVEDWLALSFAENEFPDTYAKFQSIILDYQEPPSERGLLRRELQMTAFSAEFDGVSVWETTGSDIIPTETEVLALELNALVNQEDQLLEDLQDSESLGLGDNVVNVDSNLVERTAAPTSAPSSGDDLDAVVIVAIVIAGLAFCLLVFALYMAWRYRASLEGSQQPSSRSKRKSKKAENTSPNASPAANAAITPPSVIDHHDDGDTGIYPESLISEDISTSLTAYYRSGMGPSASSNRNNSGGLNDAASVSSMESYGYSLDGYASSIQPTKDDDPY